MKASQWLKCGGDPENSMIYSADMGMRKVAGIQLDPASSGRRRSLILELST